MSRLAIIIPHVGSAASLESTLASVLANRPEDSEVLVVLQQSYEDPYHIQDEVRFIPGHDRGGVADAVNLGVQNTDAPLVHVLSCGVEVQEGWSDAAVVRFGDPRVAAVSPMVLDAGDPERIVAAGLAYQLSGAIVALAQGCAADSLGTSPKRVLAPHPTAAFYRKSILETIGGFDPWVGDRLAVLDAGLMLRQLGWITVLEPKCRVVVPRQGLLPGGAFCQAMEAERLFWRWAPLVGRFRSILSHGVFVTGEAIRSLFNLSILPRWAGRIAGAMAAAVAPAHGRPVDRLRDAQGAESTPRPDGPHFRLEQASPNRSHGDRRKRAG